MGRLSNYGSTMPKSRVNGRCFDEGDKLITVAVNLHRCIVKVQ